MKFFLMLAHGFRIKEIAAKLCISDRTVTTHQERIYQKLKIHHRASLIQFSPYYLELLNLLTPRESTIIELLTQDLCSEDIAEELNLTVETIYSHRKSINKKLRGLQEKYDVLGIFRQKQISFN
ncbi:Transcriptional regulatory protein RcsB [Acinetobacter venetianus]|uniref:Transcriptional regulatory protein RcsB n=3 Tax=Acinetobacter venetianus TaxID=52133 RepID=A0A150HN51_9GAMM|nr:Transcriptional regulatory protein RcsB [Acinetobacter venetianus]